MLGSTSVFPTACSVALQTRLLPEEFPVTRKGHHPQVPSAVAEKLGDCARQGWWERPCPLREGQEAFLQEEALPAERKKQ